MEAAENFKSVIFSNDGGDSVRSAVQSDEFSVNFLWIKDPSCHDIINAVNLFELYLCCSDEDEEVGVHF